jgi:alcohol dehydrogenase class IV
MHKVKPETIIGIGGGSPIDAGKAANVVYTHGGVVKDYDIATGGIMRIMPKLLPFIAVPTTAGTGTEVTYVGVITDVKNKTKYGVLSPLVIPDVALLDPETLVSLPPDVSAATGIDALTHCIEAYTAITKFPPADAFAIHGIKLIANNLRAAVNDAKNLKAKEEMLLASMMAGTAFSLNGLGVCHAMAHQASATYHLAHGVVNAILLPHVMKFNLSACPERFADVAVAMGADIKGLSVEKAAEKSLELVSQLCADVKIPKYFENADKSEIPGMVERALHDNPITTNPRKCSAEDVTALYNKAIKQ